MSHVTGGACKGSAGSRDTRSARRHRTVSAASCLGTKYRDRFIYMKAARGRSLLGQSLDSVSMRLYYEEDENVHVHLVTLSLYAFEVNSPVYWVAVSLANLTN